MDVEGFCERARVGSSIAPGARCSAPDHPRGRRERALRCDRRDTYLSSAGSRNALHPRVNAFDLRCNCPALRRQWRVDGAAIDDRELDSRLPSPRMFGGTSDVQGEPSGVGLRVWARLRYRGGIVLGTLPQGWRRAGGRAGWRRSWCSRGGAAGGANDDKVGSHQRCRCRQARFRAGWLGRRIRILSASRWPASVPATVSPGVAVSPWSPRDAARLQRSITVRHWQTSRADSLNGILIAIPLVDPGSIHIGSPNVRIHALPGVRTDDQFTRMAQECNRLDDE